MYRQQRHEDAPIIPPVKPPTGLQFYFGTWTGRLILVNAAVFIAMSWLSHSLLLPTEDVLNLFGAKDPVALARGEWWRFVTPIFVHIGIIHFGFNTVGLYYVGYQVERLIGAGWFIAMFIITGAIGNAASSVFTMAVSAGASGALFGLLGCGYLVEYRVGKQMQDLTGRKSGRKAYSSMVFANVLLGFFIPAIDNAAHLGGLISGITLTYVMLNLRPNRLYTLNKTRGKAIAVLLLATSSVLFYLGTNRSFILSRLVASGDKASEAAKQYFYYDRALQIEPEDGNLLVKRARLFILNEELQNGLSDLAKVGTSPSDVAAVEKLIEELRELGYVQEAEAVERQRRRL